MHVTSCFLPAGCSQAVVQEAIRPCGLLLLLDDRLSSLLARLSLVSRGLSYYTDDYHHLTTTLRGAIIVIVLRSTNSTIASSVVRYY